MNIQIKRVYDTPNESDGIRILVDRIWPRGLSKDKARIDLWIKDIAPSNELRKWYSHDPEKWPEFKHRYFEQLKNNNDVKSFLHTYRTKKVTFLYGSKEAHMNNAQALKEYAQSHT